MNRTLLLDGDIFIYQAASASEESINWGNGLWTLHAFENKAIQKLVSTISDLRQALKTDEIIIALSSHENWRKDLLPTYKENRKHTRKPMLLGFLRQFLKDKYQCICWNRLEADDVLGILATSDEIQGEKIVVTIDKDLKSVPCNLYLCNRPEKGIQKITEEQADRWHMIQTLTGDSTDGYKGCPGIGLVRAERALKEKEKDTWWDVVVNLYEKQGLGEEEAKTQSSVARILRAEHYDRQSGEILL